MIMKYIILLMRGADKFHILYSEFNIHLQYSQQNFFFFLKIAFVLVTENSLVNVGVTLLLMSEFLFPVGIKNSVSWRHRWLCIFSTGILDLSSQQATKIYHIINQTITFKGHIIISLLLHLSFWLLNFSFNICKLCLQIFFLILLHE